jgi:hypothetical protein
LQRPVLVKLEKRGSSWAGTMAYATYFNHYEGTGAERHVTSWDVREIKLLVEVAPKGTALSKPKPAERR